MPPHPDAPALDCPIWSALTTVQAGLALGGASARRYPADMAPFAATADDSPAALDALQALIPTAGAVALFTTAPIVPPAGLALVHAATLTQMIAPGPLEATPAHPEPTVRELGDGDIADMQALVELTKPGPFGPRTHVLGRYIGIRVDGVLAAMAGERMRLARHVELSAICVHPDHRGRGHAQRLIAELMHAAYRQGLTPILHVFDNNAGAIALYRQLGFVARAGLHLAVLRQSA